MPLQRTNCVVFSTSGGCVLGVVRRPSSQPLARSRARHRRRQPSLVTRTCVPPVPSTINLQPWVEWGDSDGPWGDSPWTDMLVLDLLYSSTVYTSTGSGTVPRSRDYVSMHSKWRGYTCRFLGFLHVRLYGNVMLTMCQHVLHQSTPHTLSPVILRWWCEVE